MQWSGVGVGRRGEAVITITIADIAVIAVALHGAFEE
jgi:hypothetical protein